MRRSTMLLTSAGLLVSTTALAIAISACGGADQPPATSPSAQPYPGQAPAGYYPQQQQPQQGFPQPTGEEKEGDEKKNTSHGTPGEVKEKRGLRV